ncbi:MAG: DUF4276 family protein, partial [Elusimicrobiota bacterium]|nr:DUF4276 family protein [Elusimicrobiota bacterium]
AKRAEYPITTTLIDYYGLKDKGNKKVEEVEQELSDNVNKEHFISYIQLHETEALWFSNSQIIAQVKNADSKQIGQLNKIVKQYPNPEDINDGNETAPSKRLEKIFSDYGKIVDGNMIFEKISVDEMKTKCPRFAQWLKKIETEADKIRNKSK